MLSAEGLREVEEILTRYPTRRAAILPLMHLVSREKGYVSAEAEEWIGQQLELAPVKVHEVLTFYTMFKPEPVGRYHLQVCRTLSCELRGCKRLLAYIHDKLGLKTPEAPGADGRFSYEEVECLGACGNAPVVQINEDYHHDVTVEKLEALLASLE